MNNGLQSEMGAVARACLAFRVSTFTNKKYYIYIPYRLVLSLDYYVTLHKRAKFESNEWIKYSLFNLMFSSYWLTPKCFDNITNVRK